MIKFDDKDYESIIPTAILTAYPRIFTDIPYSKEMFYELDKRVDTSQQKNETLATEIEARYKLTDKLLEKENITQVLELASGYTARGLTYAQNPNITYVELDLDKVIKLKTEMISNFATIPSNLHLLSGNALNEEDIERACEFFDENKPVAIINEGLMRYLNFEEKEHLGKIIKKVLDKFGGVWITCDVTPAKFIQSQDTNMNDFNKTLSNTTERNNASWRFRNIEHVKEFYGKLGLSMEVHEFKEIKPYLSAPKIMNIEDKDIDKLLDFAIVAVFK